MNKELRDLLEANAKDLSNLDEVSWDTGDGILISGREALEIVAAYDLLAICIQELIEIKQLMNDAGINY